MSTWHYPQVYWLPLPSKLLAKGETTDTQAAERASTSNGGLLHDLLLGSRGVGEGPGPAVPRMRLDRNADSPEMGAA
jgi:hypothetical protein